jgi:phage shock protein A
VRRFNDVSEIATVNWNDLVGSCQDRKGLFEQVVREVEEAISATNSQALSAMALENGVACELERNRYQAQLWQSRVMRAVEAGDDELARKALARKQEHQKLAGVLEDRLEAARVASVGRRRQLEVLKLRLAEAKRFQASLLDGEVAA